jgi:succinyl-CoA synthetase beta subunit
VGALEQLGGTDLPVVVRLEGTNVEEGRRILREAPFPFVVAEHMADAAEKVVAAVGERPGAGRGARVEG